MLGIEARGFTLRQLAYHLKAASCPCASLEDAAGTEKISYALEYGEDSLRLTATRYRRPTCHHRR